MGGVVVAVIVLGLILVIVGYLLQLPPVVVTLGIILLVIGVILELAGAFGHPVGGRRHYW